MCKEEPKDFIVWGGCFVIGVIAGKLLGWWVLGLSLIFILLVIVTNKRR